jgi:hypothetical protein
VKTLALDDLYTEESVSIAFNRAADEILNAVDAPDTGIRDAISLLVNVGMTYLIAPGTELKDAIAATYDSDARPLDWIVEG